MLWKIADVGLSRNLNPDLSYTCHALHYSIMLPVVLVSSWNCLCISKTPLPRLYVSLGQDLSLISSHPGAQLSAWHGVSSQ